MHTEDPSPSMEDLPSGVASSFEISMLGVDTFRIAVLSDISESSGDATRCASAMVFLSSTLETFDSA